jgi:hypothetical protein
MNFVNKTIGDPEAHPFLERVHHSNGNVGVSTIAQNVDAPTIAQNVDADNCTADSDRVVNRGRNILLVSENVVSRETTFRSNVEGHSNARSVRRVIEYLNAAAMFASRNKKRRLIGRPFLIWKLFAASSLAASPSLSLLFLFGRLLGRKRWLRWWHNCLRLCLIPAVHAFLESAHAFAHPAHQFRNFAPAKEN